MTADPTPAVCAKPTLSGQSAHGHCGGFLPEDPRHNVFAAACDVEKLLKRPRSVEWLRARLRPEFRDLIESALEVLEAAGKLEPRRVHGQLKLALAPARRPRRVRDDGSADGLFSLRERG
jgi:hypothetical protein